jgi:hypothetical protein
MMPLQFFVAKALKVENADVRLDQNHLAETLHGLLPPQGGYTELPPTAQSPFCLHIALQADMCVDVRNSV